MTRSLWVVWTVFLSLILSGLITSSRLLSEFFIETIARFMHCNVLCLVLLIVANLFEKTLVKNARSGY